MLRNALRVSVLIALAGGLIDRSYGQVQPPPPTAGNDSAYARHNRPVMIPVLNNDTPPPLNQASLVITSHPLHGEVFVNFSTGEVTYTPDEGYGGADEFRYKVANMAGVWSNIAIVSVTVEANVAPQIVEFFATMGDLGFWHFEGRVVDETPALLTIQFGGILEEVTTEVAEDGTFYLCKQMNGQTGLVTAQTTDPHGLDSNIAQAEVAF
jgi:hypothetical protein